MTEAPINTFERMIAPLSPDQFLTNVWGVRHLHVRGWPGKFAGLLAWESLNAILAHHRLDFPRLRLAQDGKTLPSSSYLRHNASARNRSPVPRLKTVELTEKLRQGATLVLDAVDELHEPVRTLSRELEHIFRERVQVNSYSGWRTSNGFDLHWDDHDVFILQVTGRKRWKIYGMTRPHPLTGERGSTPKPTHEPLWEETLEDGDLLYIPRGWWHVALPLDEPTLHLTVGVHNRTGIDLLRWLTERVRESETFRRDLPRFASPEERAAHSERLRDELFAAWDESSLERFLADYDAKAEPRPLLSLPHAATPRVLPHARDAVVRFNAPRPVEMKVEGETVEFRCIGKRWRFDSRALAVLRPLAERRACTVAELCEAARGTLDEATTKTFLSELALRGLVTITEG